LRPHPEETVLMPHKGIDVWQTDLPEHLQRLGTTHLVIAGMTANLCCESTGRHAMEEGYDVTFLSNAIGADNIAAYEAAIHLSYPLIANAVLEVEEFLEAIGASTDAHIQVQPGDTVFGSDHGEIGTVDEVVQKSEQTPGYLLIAQGLIFKHNTFIPLDAVVKRAGTKVFVNVPRIILQNMPWDEPPSYAEQQAKQGPRAANVQELYGSRSPSIHEQSTQSEHGADMPG
ncbi:MAG: cysteine hydrolase, partial [Chloroflexota bacterium]|nr:cysteine hydrolase [Chloroflexota bacterium]